MATETSGVERTQLYYDTAAERYLRSLPMEHFMESIPQATQRKITLESFDLIHAARPEVQCFNELLVQYPKKDQPPGKLGQVVPDNMVVIHATRIVATTNFAIPLQPVGPFLTLEYVSKHNVRKDYELNYDRYEQELKVPYYLIFYPDADELSVFKLRGEKYTSVLPNEAGRLDIPELELEVALLDRWVRFWFRGELLPLPADLLNELNTTKQALNTTKKDLDVTKQDLNTTKQDLDTTKQDLDTTKQDLNTTKQDLDATRTQLTSAEAEIARLKAELAKRGQQP